MNHQSLNQRGFTLIEIMIAVTILGVLTMLTARAMKAGIANKTKFQADVAREGAVRDALRVMERDINLAYHYRDFNADLMNQAKLAAKSNGQTTTTSNTTTTGSNGAANNNAGAANQNVAQPQLPEAEQTKPIPQWTGLVGDEKSIYFTSLSNVRLTQDAQESREAEIGYYTKTCKSTDGKDHSSTCLMRSITPIIDDDLEKGGAETVLLENVVSFKLQYIGPGFEEWQNSWVTKTVKHADGNELFPYAVQIYIKTYNKDDPKEKPFEMESVAELRFPNNDPKKESDAIANPK